MKINLFLVLNFHLTLLFYRINNLKWWKKSGLWATQNEQTQSCKTTKQQQQIAQLQYVASFSQVPKVDWNKVHLEHPSKSPAHHRVPKTNKHSHRQPVYQMHVFGARIHGENPLEGRTCNPQTGSPVHYRSYSIIIMYWEKKNMFISVKAYFEDGTWKYHYSLTCA